MFRYAFAEFGEDLKIGPSVYVTRGADEMDTSASHKARTVFQLVASAEGFVGDKVSHIDSRRKNWRCGSGFVA